MQHVNDTGYQIDLRQILDLPPEDYPGPDADDGEAIRGRAPDEAVADEGADDGRGAYRGRTIAADGVRLETDSFATGLNNNVAVLGPSGTGKTRGFVLPNLLEASSSYVVVDTKGQLRREVGPYLAERGYEVWGIDLADPYSSSETGYNPLDHIRESPSGNGPRELDVLSIARALCPVESETDPVWDHLAALVLSAIIAFVMEDDMVTYRDLATVAKMASGLDSWAGDALDALAERRPDSLAARQWAKARTMAGANRMWASVQGIVCEKLQSLEFDGLRRIYRLDRRVDFSRIGRERVALFVTVSDVDPTTERLVGLLLGQLLGRLVEEADHCPGKRLPVPVRVIADDFANYTIADVDLHLSVCRSREIWLNLVFQSIGQLTARYGHEGANAIMSNCDTHVLLGCHDERTARYFSLGLDRPGGTGSSSRRGDAASQSAPNPTT